MKLLPPLHILCTPYNYAPCHFMQSHICKVHACLAVTCHLHFWQNDRGLLRATAITRGWNRYRNKSQHRKSTLEKKILSPLLQGLERDKKRDSPCWCLGPTDTEYRSYYKSVQCLIFPYYLLLSLCLLLLSVM